MRHLLIITKVLLLIRVRPRTRDCAPCWSSSQTSFSSDIGFHFFFSPIPRTATAAPFVSSQLDFGSLLPVVIYIYSFSLFSGPLLQTDSFEPKEKKKLFWLSDCFELVFDLKAEERSSGVVSFASAEGKPFNW